MKRLITKLYVWFDIDVPGPFHLEVFVASTAENDTFETSVPQPMPARDNRDNVLRFGN